MARGTNHPGTTHNVFEKHDNPIDQLNDLFGVSPLSYFLINDSQTGRPVPFRRKPGVPNMRLDAEANKRRKKRKTAKASRKRNR